MSDSSFEPISDQGRENKRLFDALQNANVFERLATRDITTPEFLDITREYEIRSSAPEAAAFRRRLLDYIDKFISGKMSVDAFSDAYVLLYHTEVPGWVFGRTEGSFFDEISERVQWACSREPTTEEHSWGYRSEREFREWLADYLSRTERPK